jgi:hypothetical protein
MYPGPSWSQFTITLSFHKTGVLQNPCTLLKTPGRTDHALSPFKVYAETTGSRPSRNAQ